MKRELKRGPFCKLNGMDEGGRKQMSNARTRIVKRAVQEIQDGMNVNLGIGIPTLIANEIPADFNVLLQSENGLIGDWSLPSSRE